MKLTANDTLHLSELGPHSLQPGQEFEVSDLTGEQLVKRGLATEVKEAKAPANKMEPKPANKSAPKKPA